jgi:hypothetical protein
MSDGNDGKEPGVKFGFEDLRDLPSFSAARLAAQIDQLRFQHAAAADANPMRAKQINAQIARLERQRATLKPAATQRPNRKPGG